MNNDDKHYPRRGLKLCNTVEEYAEKTHTPIPEVIEMVSDGYLLAYPYDVETGEPIITVIEDNDAD